MMPADDNPLPLDADVCHRAVDARDARFDGVFFVGITTTGIYCRPVCPSRRALPDRRRFFASAAAAEGAGFRPCFRCRPELAPGRALVDAVPRLARAATHRIAEGALNGRNVASLASELFVSERHLRRCLSQVAGVSPADLALTHRLLLAKRLLADTTLEMTRVAYASGFQSLRRFNAAFRERYETTPGAVRRAARRGKTERGAGRPGAIGGDPGTETLRLTLAYRAPFAWPRMLAHLAAQATPGVEVVRGDSYARTVRVDGRAGVVDVRNDAEQGRVHVAVSEALFPVLMPLLARLRRLFDLDAEPGVVDAHLVEGGLGALVLDEPGVRVPGALDGFEVAMTTLLDRGARGSSTRRRLAGRVVRSLGDRMEAGRSGLDLLFPTAERVAEARPAELSSSGMPDDVADALGELARAVVHGELRLEPGSDPVSTADVLRRIRPDERFVATVVMRALSWPDAFPDDDPHLRRAAGTVTAHELGCRAEAWRPWRAYAAMRLSSVRSPGGV
jgi:AraC family transcriptional regulator of adaptative response / DNA-3-methyladenine glycosylase II